MNALPGFNGQTRPELGRKRRLSDRERDDEQVMNAILSSEEADSDSTSDSSSSSSSSSDSSSTSSSGSSSGEEGDMDNVFEEDDCGRYLNISCACNEAKFYIKRFARGSVGKCILFKNRWITPNEFQAISGRKSSKDWKRSIRLKGRCLKEFIAQGLFQEHAKTCACKICSGDDVEMLKQEGEMALAAKRRRLSQADSHTTQTDSFGMVSTPISPAPTYEKPETMQFRFNKSEKRKKEHENIEEISHRSHKIWSPSGEVAHQEEGSSNENEEDEYQPDSQSPQEADLKGIVDSQDYLPRRSRRSTHKKHTGHRTELGTFKCKPSDWDAEEVAEFLKIHGYTEYADPFLESEIDGQSLFMLREQHLMERFNMKLGPALRLLDTISRLRHPPLVS